MELNYSNHQPTKLVPLRQVFAEARDRLGLTQKEVAEACGITPSALSQYESGLSGLRTETLERLRGALTEAAIKKAWPKIAELSQLAQSNPGPLTRYAFVSEMTRARHFLADINRELQEEFDAKLIGDEGGLSATSKDAQILALEQQVKELQERLANLKRTPLRRRRTRSKSR